MGVKYGGSSGVKENPRSAFITNLLIYRAICRQGVMSTMAVFGEDVVTRLGDCVACNAALGIVSLRRGPR